MGYQLPTATALHLTCIEPHSVVLFCKSTVDRTLISTVCIEVLDLVTSHALTVSNGFLQKMAVGFCHRSRLYRSYDAGLVVFYRFGDIGDVTGNLLPVLVAECSIGIVRALEALGGYGLLVAQLDFLSFHDILVIEHSLQQLKVWSVFG